MDVTSYLLGKQQGGGGTPNLQNKDITITENGETNVSADAGYDGLQNVGITTNVTPSLQNKSETISSNTTTQISADSGYDGLGTVSITTNVQPSLETLQETITTNGTKTYTPSQDKDGFSSVEITTNVSGGGVDEYFNTVINENQSFSSSNPSLPYFIKKMPPITINTHSCNALFRNVGVLKIENLTFTTSVYNAGQMFQGCNGTAIIDISGLDTSEISSSSNMFGNCGNLCKQSDGAYADGIPYVYVKDVAAQSFVLSTNNVPSSWTTNNVIVKQ